MGTQDQVVWPSVNIPGATYQRGALLPDAVTDEESDYRALLRIGGALRVVEVVYTPEELAAMAGERAETTAVREAALSTDPAAPSGEATAGGASPGRPTLAEPSGAPIVVGSEEDKASRSRSSRSSGGAGGGGGTASGSGGAGSKTTAT